MVATDTRQAVRLNTLKSALLVAGFPFVLPSLIFVVAATALTVVGRHDALVIAVRSFSICLWIMAAVTIIWLPIGYFINQWVIDRATGARLLNRSALPDLWDTFAALCDKCQIRMPVLRIIETEVLNAFASGLAEGRYSVTVTRGLYDALNRDEMEAVLAHELTHIRNHDVRLLVVAMVMVGTIPMVHNVIMKVYWALIMGLLTIYRAAFRLLKVPLARLIFELGYGGMFLAGKVIAYAIGLVATVCSLVIHFALSRQREFMADAGAVAISGKPDALIGALRKISGTATLDTTIVGLRAMCFESAAFGWFGLFATHPPIEERIQAVARLSRAAPVARALEPARPSARMRIGVAPNDPSQTGQRFDPATVERYRLLLLRGNPDLLNAIEREHLYRRLRQAVQNGQQTNAALTDAQIAYALGCLEAAIGTIETTIAVRR